MSRANLTVHFSEIILDCSRILFCHHTIISEKLLEALSNNIFERTNQTLDDRAISVHKYNCESNMTLLDSETWHIITNISQCNIALEGVTLTQLRFKFSTPDVNQK